MTQDSTEVLTALLDGEPVAPEALAAALLAPGGREALLDFVRLRTEIAADDSRPSPAFYGAMDRTLTRRAPRRAAWRAVQAVAAAVVLALAVVGAVSLPGGFTGNEADEPPRATRVLTFTPGVDWHEGRLR